MLKTLIAGALVFVTAIPVSPQTGKVSVQGTVIRLDTRQPLVDARVTIGISSLGPLQSPIRLLNFLSAWTVAGTEFTTVTDRVGRFAFPNLDPGDYIVTAALDGYTNIAKNSDGTSQVSDFARGMTLRVGERSGNVVLSLMPLANIKGQVRSPNGQGVAGVYVIVGSIDYSHGQRTWQHEDSTRTNENGEYQILWREPGRYYVAVAPQEGGLDYRQFVAAYYPDSLSFGSARPIDVVSGSNPAADITLPFKKSGLTVSGKVATGVLVRETFPGGSSAGPDMVHLAPRGGDWVLNSPVSNPLSSWISSSGDFQIRDVAPGSYDIYAVSNQRSRTYWGHIAVDVTDRDVTDQAIVFGASSADYVSGRVVDENGVTYRANSSVLLARRTLLPFLNDYGNVRGGGGINPDPYFGFSRVLPGTYDLVVSYDGCDDCYLADILQAGRSIVNSGLVIDNNPPEPIDVLLRHGGGTVEIRIQGEPGHNGLVLLVPEASRRVNSSFFQDINITSGYLTTFENIAPGQYKVFAIEGSSDRRDLDVTAFLSRHENEGASVTIRDGEKATARVDLIRR